MRNKELYISAFLTIALATLAISAFAPVFAAAQVDSNSSKPTKLPTELFANLTGGPNPSLPVLSNYKATNTPAPAVLSSQRQDDSVVYSYTPDSATYMKSTLTGYYPTEPPSANSYTVGYWKSEAVNTNPNGWHLYSGYIWVHWWTSIEDPGADGGWLPTYSYSSTSGVNGATQLFNFCGVWTTLNNQYRYIEAQNMLQAHYP